MREHNMKCWPEQFQAIMDGRKNFELRLNDRAYAVGDRLILHEWKPQADPLAESYGVTGRQITKFVTYIYYADAPATKGALAPSWIIMALK